MLIGVLVIIYLFLGGCGAGALLITSAWSLAFHRTENRAQRLTDSFRGMKLRCFQLGFALLVVSAACLVLDLGRPDRMLLLFVRPTFSTISFGSFVLLATILLGGFLIAANSFANAAVPSRMKKAAEVLCILCSFLAMVYTGVFLQSVASVALWATPLVPMLFALSSFSAGCAIVSLVMPFSVDELFMLERAGALRVAHIVVLVLEAFVLAAFVVRAVHCGRASDSLALLFGVQLGPWFFVGVVGLGILLPLAIELLMLVARRGTRVLPVDLACLLGCFLLRFCLVAAGMH